MKTSSLTVLRRHLIQDMRFVLTGSCKSDKQISEITGLSMREIGKVRSRSFSDSFPIERLVEISNALGMKVVITVKERSSDL